MRDTITIPVSSLITLANELKADNMDYVDLYIMDVDELDDGDVIPVTLSTSAFKSATPNVKIGYDFIEHVDKFD